MRFLNLTSLLSLAVLSLTASPGEALTPSRAYAWSMDKGNLLPNWSFENFSQFWFDTAPAGFTVTSRFLASSGVPGGAKTGSFVAKASGTSQNNNTNNLLNGESFPVLPGQLYTLSFYYQASSLTGSTRPDIDFFSDHNNTPISSQTGAAYTTQGAWTFYSVQFTAPDIAQFAALTLVQSKTQGSGGTFYFDDVILEEGGPTVSDMLVERTRITESMSFGDGFGRTLQSQTKIAPGKYLVGGTGYDDLGRPDSTFLPFPVSQSGAVLNANLLSASKAYYTGAAGKGPDATGYPFSEVLYAGDPGSRVTTKSAPGAAWKLTGTHTVKNGFFYTSFLYQLPDNIENPSTDNTEGNYRVDWVRDADSNYTLTWTNRLGQVAQEMRPLTHTGLTSGWKLSATQYEYYPDGRLRRVRTPLDVQAVNYNFAEVYEFNTLGELTSKFTPNSGLCQYWYDRSGNLRYSQDSGENLRGQYSYRAYDEQGRLKSEGLQTLSSLTQDMADQDDYAGGTRDEEIGYIYDDFSTFQARTGYALDAIMPYYYFFDGTHSQGRLVCAYNRNSANSTYGLTTQDKLIADFYDYDERGRMVKTLKSVQPIRNPDMKYQDGYFTYDENDRLVETYNFVDAASGTLSNQHLYLYDSLGRLSQVQGLSNKPLAQFKYYDWGPVQQVLLGGDGTGTKGTKVEYFYNVHGAIQEIRATDLLNAKIVYQDFLGYDQKSNSASTVPNAITPRFNGTISQELYRFTNDVAALDPIRLMNYDYDGLGRMIKADYRKSTETQPFYSDGTVNFSILAWNTTSAEQSSSFNYDLNGRITGQRTGGIAAADSARYIYRPNTYQVGQVTGKINGVVYRDMSQPGAFNYDEQGNVTWDGSKGMNVQYNWNQQPIAFYVEGATFGLTEAYYDAGGNRVFNRVDDNTQAVCKYYLDMGAGMSKEYEEVLDENTLAIKSTSVTVNLFANKQVGRIRSDGVYEFFIKNHQGSTMKTMGVLGGDPPSGGTSYDYLAYGDVRKLRETGSSVTQKYTGKEYEDMTRLTYFGSRFYDPELGLWLVPDAAGQFVNPYSFTGGSPVMSVDADGNWSGWDDALAIVGGAVAGYVGNALATGNWFSARDFMMAGVGVAAGEAALYTGGASLTALSGMGVTGVGGTLAAGAAGGLVGGSISGFGGYSVGAAYGGSWNAGDALKATGIGAFSGAIGGVAGGYVSLGTLSFGGTSITSPIIKGVFGGAVGGYAGGFVGGYLSTGSLTQANKAGLNGAALGGAMGGITGYVSAKFNDIDPWTGARQTNSSGLGSDDIVCRGGTCTTDKFENGSGVRIVDGKLVDVSVQAGPGASINDLTSTIPNKQVGTTTVGRIQALGGSVTPSPTFSNPLHCTLCGITPTQAEQLFTPTIKNPSIGY